MSWWAGISFYRTFIKGHGSGSLWNRWIAIYDNEGALRGSLVFKKDGSALNDARDVDIGGTKRRAVLEFHESQYADVLDLLRNEKPLFIQYISPKVAYVATSEKEPVGENE